MRPQTDVSNIRNINVHMARFNNYDGVFI